MRVHVISDMEGVAGIVKWQQVGGGEALFEEGRKLYTEEINAAVRGAKAAGATEVVVMDCHGAGEGWTFNSLIPDLLDPDCEYVVQDECKGCRRLRTQQSATVRLQSMHERLCGGLIRSRLLLGGLYERIGETRERSSA